MKKGKNKGKLVKKSKTLKLSDDIFWRVNYEIGSISEYGKLGKTNEYIISKKGIQKALFIGFNQNRIIDILKVVIDSKDFNSFLKDIEEWVKPLPKLYISRGVIIQADNEEIFNELLSKKIKDCTWTEKLSENKVFLADFDYNSFMKFFRNKEIEVIDYGKKKI